MDLQSIAAQLAAVLGVDVPEIEEVEDTRPRIRIHAGSDAQTTERLFREALGLPPPRVMQLVPKTLKLVVGMICPKCHGGQRCKKQTTGEDIGLCFWCTNGKGRLTARDIGFITARMNNAEALNYLQSA